MSTIKIKKTSRLAFTAAVLASAGVLHAAPAFPALERAALAVRAPERQVMQAAAIAGNRLVVVGERGLVVLSDDAGGSWRQARLVPVSTTLTAVSFAGDREGWAVGHGGVVLHTQDGGETWVKQADGKSLAQAALQSAEEALKRSPNSAAAARAVSDANALVADGPDKPLLDVLFQDAQHGWIVGAYNLFFETRDGGKTWVGAGQRLSNPKALHLNAIAAQGEVIYIVGEQGQMHRSLNGGQSFESLASPYKGSWFSLAAGSDGSVVVAGLRGNAFYSADRGRQWKALEGAPPVSFISARTGNDGSVLLGNQAGQLFSSQSGTALQPVQAPVVQGLTGLLVLKDQRLLALGFAGVATLPAPGLNGTSK